MYYEEKLINGVLHYRTTPNGEWRVMNTLRQLVNDMQQWADDQDTDIERECYEDCATQLSAELPKWERAIKAAKELLHARSKGCTEVAGYDDNGHPLTREGVASKNLRDALKEIEQ